MYYIRLGQAEATRKEVVKKIIGVKMQQYKNGGFRSKLSFMKCVSFCVSYQPDVQNLFCI